jgi:hypothetical protein
MEDLKMFFAICFGVPLAGMITMFVFMIGINAVEYMENINFNNNQPACVCPPEAEGSSVTPQAP